MYVYIYIYIYIHMFILTSAAPGTAGKGSAPPAAPRLISSLFNVLHMLLFNISTFTY